MPARTTWAPNRKGSIPESVQEELKARLLCHAQRRWERRIAKLLVRFRGRHAYIAAIERTKGDASPITVERFASEGTVPVELCRLGYLGSADEWEYSFYKYSDERYELSVTASGRFSAMPEDGFDTSAMVYLAGGEQD